MSLRTKLIKLTDEGDINNKVFDLLHATDPSKASLTDLLFLLRLTKPNRNNPLAYLQLEAKIWLDDNKDVLTSRLAQENN